ncbi:MAG: DNA-binding protein [Halobacteriovoraceae bacterium]|jgi:hemolysin III|nr:DNA-binding protein [Halobacteriovoraceae bacterium]
MNIIQIPGFSEPFSSISHLLGAVVFFIGMFFLIIKAKNNNERLIALLLYSLSLIFLFSMSGVYHLLEPALTPRYVLRHLDYAGIWILIAGSFIPMHMILFRGRKRWGILAPVLLVAIVGLTLQMIFFSTIPEWLSLMFFLSLGWMGVISMWMLKKFYSELNYSFLILGGAAYSIGAVLEFVRWPVVVDGVIGPHEVFHVFVLMGAMSHWWFIHLVASHPTAKVLKVEIRKDLASGKFFAVGKNELISLAASTKSDLYKLINEWVLDNYHPSMKPIKVVINEVEILSLNVENA